MELGDLGEPSGEEGGGVEQEGRSSPMPVEIRGSEGFSCVYF